MLDRGGERGVKVGGYTVRPTLKGKARTYSLPEPGWRSGACRGPSWEVVLLGWGWTKGPMLSKWSGGAEGAWGTMLSHLGALSSLGTWSVMRIMVDSGEGGL